MRFYGPRPRTIGPREKALLDEQRKIRKRLEELDDKSGDVRYSGLHPDAQKSILRDIHAERVELRAKRNSLDIEIAKARREETAERRATKNATIKRKPRNECQICERIMALDKGLLGNHGYERPGCGWIVGNCFGVDHKPFPATDALKKWLAFVNEMIAKSEETLVKIPNLTEIIVYKRTGKQDARGIPERGAVIYKKGEPWKNDAERARYGYSYKTPFDMEIDAYERTTKNNLRSQREEKLRIEARIKKAEEIAA